MFLVNTKSDCHVRQTYSNNFENTHLHIDGFILNLLFQPLLTRLNQMEDNLFNIENLGLFNECRSFLFYMKENHGGIFRSAVFSALIQSEKKLARTQQIDDENLIVDFSAIQTGLLRLHFILKCSPPGIVPDPHFLNNFLFLVRISTSNYSIKFEFAFVESADSSQSNIADRMCVFRTAMFDGSMA